MRLRFAALVALLAAGGKTLAQTATVAPIDGYSRKPAAASEPARGWVPEARVGANLAFASNQAVIGQVDGSSETYGLNLRLALSRIGERDEWRNSLSLLEATSRNPSLPAYVKTNDELRFQTAYLHDVGDASPWGPYVKAEASAPVFVGQDVRATPQTYRIERAGGASETVAGTTLRLTDPFRPLTTKESVGAFWRAVDGERFKLEARAGAAAFQIAADGQLSVRGVGASGQVDVRELSSVSQAGLELALGAKAKIDDRSAAEAGFESLTPFVDNRPSQDARSPFELTNVDAFAKLTTKAMDWAFFAYDYRLRIQPQLLAAAQQIHLLTFNVSYDFFGGR